MKPDTKNAGFTLIEMMVVLVLVAAVAAISLPYSTSAGDHLRLMATARTLAARFEVVRTAAISQNAPFVLQIDPKARKIFEVSNAIVDLVPMDFAITIKSAQNEEIAGAATFKFFSDGGTTGGQVIFIKGKRTASVSLNWLTGAAVVETGELQ